MVAFVLISFALLAAILWIAWPVLAIRSASGRPSVSVFLRWDEGVLTADLFQDLPNRPEIVPISLELVEQLGVEAELDDIVTPADEPLPPIPPMPSRAQVRFSGYKGKGGTSGDIRVGYQTKRAMGPLSTVVHTTVGVPADIPTRPIAN